MASVPPSIAALPARTPALGALLERWCNINSGSGHAAGLTRMRETLRADFAQAFPAATITELMTDAPGFNPPGSRALSISLRPTAPTQVILCGHYDTVYEADDAFQTCRWLDDATLNGPGTADMKGGLVTLLAALQAFEATPHAARVGWEVLLTPDEETGSHGTVELFRAASRRHQFGFVFEPGRPNGNIIHSRKGTGGIVATCHGRAAHAAKVPNDGRSAILALAEFLLEAAKIPSEMADVMVNVGNIRGGTAATNVVPHFAESELDIRITQVADGAPLLARFHALAERFNARDGIQLTLKGGFNRPPKESGPVEVAALGAYQLAAHELGLAPFKSVHTGGASDGNNLAAAGLPNLDALGPIGDRLHSADEFVRLGSLVDRAHLTARVMAKLATAEVVLPPLP